MPPRPIPANTTASIIAKAVAVDVTYKRKKRSQITSSARRMAPAAMLTKSRFHGGDFANGNRKQDGREVCPAISGFAAEKNQAITAAVQLMAAALKPVPKSPHAPTRYASPARAPATAPSVLNPYS